MCVVGFLGGLPVLERALSRSSTCCWLLVKQGASSTGQARWPHPPRPVVAHATITRCMPPPSTLFWSALSRPFPCCKHHAAAAWGKGAGCTLYALSSTRHQHPCFPPPSICSGARTAAPPCAVVYVDLQQHGAGRSPRPPRPVVSHATKRPLPATALTPVLERAQPPRPVLLIHEAYMATAARGKALAAPSASRHIPPANMLHATIL